MDYYSNGKLLITAEYLVLEGAKSLAIPTKYGQYLTINSLGTTTNTLFWKSIDVHDKEWFSCKINYNTMELISSSNKEIANTLILILVACKTKNSTFLTKKNDLEIITNLDFEKKWGLGTSSTLINNIASWANIDAFDLQFKIFGGSAYDIACAKNNTPIIYQLKNNTPIIEKVDFNPNFKDNLYFIYLNNKQNSRDSIEQFNKNKHNLKSAIIEITNITNKISKVDSLIEFELLIQAHEKIIGSILKTEPIQKRLFSDYFGQIKSLGAWGGDFILATGNNKTSDYFKNKGFKTIIPFSKMIL